MLSNSKLGFGLMRLPKDKNGTFYSFQLLSFNFIYSSTGSKSSLPTPQSGQTQSSGISSNAVPGAIPPSGSPTAGS